MTAYNYDTQSWLEGPAAAAIRHTQILEELRLLIGRDGERYARFVGIEDREATIARLEMEAAGLAGAL